MNLTFWRRKSLHAIVADELYEARRDLLAAERQLDYWLAFRSTLQARVKRLEAIERKQGPTLTDELTPFKGGPGRGKQT